VAIEIATEAQKRGKKIKTNPMILQQTTFAEGDIIKKEIEFPQRHRKS
jgi:hypothetical protein